MPTNGASSRPAVDASGFNHARTGSKFDISRVAANLGAGGVEIEAVASFIRNSRLRMTPKRGRTSSRNSFGNGLAD